MKKEKVRKSWPAYKYWTEYLMQREPRKKWIEICRGNNQTVHHTLSIILANRDDRPYTKKQIDKWAETLATGLNQAIKMLWASGNERYVVGIGRIERITNNPFYRIEHFRRIGHMLDQRKLAAKAKSFGATLEQCREFGLPLPKELKESSKRLLLGDTDFDVHLKSKDIESNIDIYFCKQCHNKFPKPNDDKCPFCQSKKMKIM